MALMTKIRDNMTKAFAVFAALFIIYIVLDWGMDFLDRRSRGLHNSDALGSVNGKDISYKYFSELLKRSIENYKAQTGTDPDEETERQIRSQVWNQIIEEYLLQQEIERRGITVNDQEIRDIIMGPNPPEFLVRQFTDSTGTFRRDIYEQAMVDPQNKQAWIQVEDILREEQKRRKLQNILLASIHVAESEVRQRFIDDATSLEADFVLFEVNRLVPDTAVTVTESDLKKVYDEQSEQFKAKPARKIKYIIFSTQPSSADTQAILKEATYLKEQIVKGSLDYYEAVKTYSDAPATEAFFAPGELSRQKENAVFSARKGEIVGPVIDNDGCHLIKILDERQGSTEFVKVRHILINVVPGPDSAKALETTNSLLKRLRAGEDFATLAQQYSQDNGSAQQGGDLGWAKKGMFVKPFEDAMYRTPVGQITGPVRTQFGWHIIKVEGKTKREVKILPLTLKIKPSNETIDAVYQRAQDFAAIARDEGFERAAENSKYEVRETPEFTKAGFIPGIGMHDGIVNFAFNNSVGTISEPMSMRQAYIICKVSFVRDEGLRPFDEVKPMIQSIALHKKKMEYIYSQVEQFYKSLTPATDLLTAAASLNNVVAQKTGPFKPSGYPAPVGRDLKFIGTSLALNVGEISKPVEGTRGYYIIKLTSKTPFDTAQYKAQYKQLHDALLKEKRTAFFNQWLVALKEKAKIVDNRDMYYR